MFDINIKKAPTVACWLTFATIMEFTMILQVLFYWKSLESKDGWNNRIIIIIMLRTLHTDFTS